MILAVDFFKYGRVPIEKLVHFEGVKIVVTELVSLSDFKSCRVDVLDEESFDGSGQSYPLDSLLLLLLFTFAGSDWRNW